jgi:NAD(P)H dehydrogenase (quinone)
MSYVVTAASGHLGRLVVLALLDRGVAPSDIVATSRDVANLADLADRGVRVHRLDYSDPTTLDGAFEAGDRVLLISGTDFGSRVDQHGNVIRAAAEAGVGLLAYTSAPYADSTSMLVAAEHLATERLIFDSGVPYALLRNGWYAENYADAVAGALAQGELVAATDGGRVSVAARADYAEAAAVVVADLDGGGHQHSTYELGGDTNFTNAELAAEVSRLTGRDIASRNVSVVELEQILTGAGFPAEAAAVYADIDRGIGKGELFIDSGDLARLIGRPTTPWADSVATFVTAG